MAESKIKITVEKNTLIKKDWEKRILEICEENIAPNLEEYDYEDCEKELKNLLEEEFGGCFKPFFGNFTSANVKCD